MTLDEAIQHAEEVAEEKERSAKLHQKPNKNVKGSGRKYNACIECASEHRQLAEWLKLLKEIWDSGDCNDCGNGQCEWKPELGQLVRFNCPYYVRAINEEVNANADNN